MIFPHLIFNYARFKSHIKMYIYNNNCTKLLSLLQEVHPFDYSVRTGTRRISVEITTHVSKQIDSVEPSLIANITIPSKRRQLFTNQHYVTSE